MDNIRRPKPRVMDKTTTRIVEDAQRKIKNLVEWINDTEDEINELVEARDRYRAERAELSGVIAKLSAGE